MNKSFRSSVVRLIIAIGTWRFITVGMALLGPLFLASTAQFSPWPNYGEKIPYWIWVWGNFDGVHYLEIARRGYRLLEQPFFPLYPLTISIVAEIFHLNHLLGGIIISHLCFVAALFIMLRLLRVDGLQRLETWFLVAIFSFPTSFAYGSVYNDALFLLLSVLTIWYGRQRQWLTASLWGALATLARLNGLALAVYLVAEYLTDFTPEILTQWRWKRDVPGLIKTSLNWRQVLRDQIWWVVLIPLSFIGYLVFVQANFGDWNLVFSTMEIWGQSQVTFPLQVLWRYFKIIFTVAPTSIIYGVALTELIFVLFYIWICWWSLKRLRWSYWVLMVVSFIIPSLTGTFAGMPRYALHLYPFFVALAWWLAERQWWIRLVYLVLVVGLMGWIITLFTRGYFVT